MSIENNNKTIYVAMSGGVDSSVAALLLKKQGWNVVGVYMMPWQPAGVLCMWHQEREDALRVATTLGIPLETWDFSRQYAQRVARPMIDGYRRGRTPNPDVECNRHIKFGLFYRRALREGADMIATGHYARCVKGKPGYSLAMARDGNKDQTYFLWGLKKNQLQRILFPIGTLLKSEVRTLARRAKLPTADKKDSQGVCFVGQLDVKQFLVRSIKQKTGLILHINGRVLGEHDGAAYYTIGQRHGLDIQDGNGPYFVVAKNVKKNIIYVGAEKDLYSNTAKITHINWVCGDAPKMPVSLDVKIRYRMPSQKAILSADGTLAFKKPQRAIASGQSAVFYSGRTLLGGGIIA